MFVESFLELQKKFFLGNFNKKVPIKLILGHSGSQIQKMENLNKMFVRDHPPD